MPLTRLTLEERIRIVRYYSVYEKATTIQKAWVNEFGTDPPSRKTIAALNKKFNETGSVADLTRSGRPKTSRTEEKIALVQNALRNDPTKSIRSLSHELGVNKASIHRIKQDTEKQSYLKQENKKLKERINELQRRLDILEGNRVTGDKKAKQKVKQVAKTNDKPVLKPMPYLVSTTIPHFQSKLGLLGIDQRQTLTVQHGVGPSHTTVITVLTNHNSHTLDLTEDLSEGQDVRHLTIDEDGHLQEVEHQLVEATGDEMLTEIREVENVQEIMNGRDMMEEEIISGDLIGNEDLQEIQTEEDATLSQQDEGQRDVGSDGEVSQGILVQEITKFDIVEAHGEELTDCTIGVPICFITTS